MRSHRDGHVHTISLAGELDLLANSHDVEAELIRVEATDASTILLDLAGLTFMDSTAIRLLITAGPRGSVVTPKPSARALGPLDVAWRNLNGARHGVWLRSAARQAASAAAADYREHAVTAVSKLVCARWRQAPGSWSATR